MKTFNKFEEDKHYRRDSDGELFCCRGNYLYAHPKIYGAYAVEELHPAYFTQVEIEEKVVKAVNKRSGKEGKVDEDGEININKLECFINADSRCSWCFSTPDHFRKLINGEFEDDFEFITEVKILEEIPHVSKVNKPIIGEVYYCKEKNRFFHVKAEKNGLYECSGFTEYYNDAQTNIQRQRLSREYVLNCLPVRAIDKFPYAEVSEITKSYKAKDTNKDLKLAIVGIKTDEQRKAVQEKAFSLGCKWLGDTEFNYYDKLQFSSIWVGCKEANYMVYDLQNYETEQIKDIQENFPEATIISVSEFLNNY